MAVMPLYPGYRRAKDADTASRVVSLADTDRETAADKQATRQGEVIRSERAARITERLRELRQWEAIARSRTSEALRLLEREGDVPAWLRDSIRAAHQEIRRVSRSLRIMREHAWELYSDCFIDEPRGILC